MSKIVCSSCNTSHHSSESCPKSEVSSINLPPYSPVALPSSKISPVLTLHHSKQPELAWKAQKDAATGKTYYINSITGLTTWKMPVELLKQVKPDALDSLSTREVARWTRMSVSLPPISPPPPPPTSPPSKRLSPASRFSNSSLSPTSTLAPPSRSPPPPPTTEERLSITKTVPVEERNSKGGEQQRDSASRPLEERDSVTRAQEERNSVASSIAVEEIMAKLAEELKMPTSEDSPRPSLGDERAIGIDLLPDRNSLTPRPHAPRRDAPRRSPSQPVQLETHHFVPDSLPLPALNFDSSRKKPAPRRCISQPLYLETTRFIPDAPPSPLAVHQEEMPEGGESERLSNNNEPSSLSLSLNVPVLLPTDLSDSSSLETTSPIASPVTSPAASSPAPHEEWLLMRDQLNREYKFKPSTGEVMWVHEEEKGGPEKKKGDAEEFMPPPPPEEEEEEEEIPLPPTNHKKTTSEPLKKHDVPPMTKPKAESLCKVDGHLQVTPKHVPKEMHKFVEEVMRPKYGQGQLLKDPELLKSFFVYIINIPENLRHVVFHEFFLAIFWREEILEQLLQFGSWKQWLLILIAEAAMTQHEGFEYVLMTLVEMFYYFFRKFSAPHNGIRQVHENKHLILDFPSQTNRTMADFLRDALTEIDRQSDRLVSFRVLSGMNLRICFWDRKPKWVRPDFTAVEWANLMASLETQEEYLFFAGPKGEFTMPRGGTEFLGLPVLESIVVLLEKLRVYHLAECEEQGNDLKELQKYYSVLSLFLFFLSSLFSLLSSRSLSVFSSLFFRVLLLLLSFSFSLLSLSLLSLFSFLQSPLVCCRLSPSHKSL